MTGSASISPARAKAAGYSNSYFSLATVPLTLKKNADKFTDWADLDKASVTVAATLGTTQEKQVKQFFPNAKYKMSRPQHAIFRKFWPAAPTRISPRMSKPISWLPNIQR